MESYVDVVFVAELVYMCGDLTNTVPIDSMPVIKVN